MTIRERFIEAANTYAVPAMGTVITVGAFWDAYKAYNQGDLESVAKNAFTGMASAYLTVESLNFYTDPARVSRAGMRVVCLIAISTLVFNFNA